MHHPKVHLLRFLLHRNCYQHDPRWDVLLHSDNEEQIEVRSLARPGEAVSQTLIRLAQSTQSPISIIPLQDYLGLGAEARMNVPGQKGRNWSWKFTWQDLVG